MLVGVHVLLALALPFVDERFVLVFEAEEEVLSITEESIGALPGLSADASEDPPVLILHQKHSVLMLSSILKEGYKTASVFVPCKNPLPVA